MWVMKSRRTRLAWHGGEERGIQGFDGNLKEREQLEDPDK
jgi:hypothetical protein